MKTSSKIIVAALTATAVGAAALPGFAQNENGDRQQFARSDYGPDRDRQGPPHARGPRHGGPHMEGRGPGGWHGRGGPGGGFDRQALIDRYDENGDGEITAAEVETVTTTRLASFDTNGDQVLSLEEFTALWTDAMQLPIVRAFQERDTDGDAEMTLEEYSVQADRLLSRLDRNADGTIDPDELRGRPGPDAQGPDQAPPAENEPAEDN